jgi:hypothetical protein
MANVRLPVDQRIEQPNENDLARIEAQRKWVREHFSPEAEHKYQVLEEKLRLLQAILDAGWIEPHETVKLQCLGITLGDAFVQDLGMEWVAVEDEYGRDPAVRYPGTTVVLFPLTMISKRIERGEAVNVAELFSGVAEHVRELLRDQEIRRH